MTKALELLKAAAHALETPGDFTPDELKQVVADVGVFLAAQENCEPPALAADDADDSGSDYVLQESHRGCWVTVRNVSVHVFITPDDNRVQVDLHPLGEEGTDPDPQESAFMWFIDADAAIADAQGMVVPRSDDPLAGHPKLRVLTDLGYDIDGDSDQPGMWIWTAPTDGCEVSYNSAVEALEAAWTDAVCQTMGILNLSSEQWDALSFTQQKELIADTLSGD